MSERFDIRLATRDDEPDIRALVGSVAMPGSVAVRFAREPDYVLGTTIMGDPCDVIVGRRASDGALAGIACRAERRSFVDGVERRTGYIGQIRIADGFRGNWLVQRGARIVRDMSPEGLVYLGVIARENPRARGALIERRPPAGLIARRLTGLTTCALLVRGGAVRPVPGIEVTSASAGLLPEVVAFLREQGRRRQLYPAYSLDDFTDGVTMRDLRPEDVLVAWRGDAIAGVLAVWDQSAYKQDVVDGYGKALTRAGPLYDAGARLFGARPLTPAGQAMPLAFAACVAVADDDPAIMRAVVRAGMARAGALGKAYLMVGFADADPLLAPVRRLPHIKYRSDAYALSWSMDPADVLDGRLPYVEIATL